MPLTKTGKKILKGMQKQYGKKEGTRIFYAMMNKTPKKTKGWHKKMTTNIIAERRME